MKIVINSVICGNEYKSFVLPIFLDCITNDYFSVFIWNSISCAKPHFCVRNRNDNVTKVIFKCVNFTLYNSAHFCKCHLCTKRIIILVLNVVTY